MTEIIARLMVAALSAAGAFFIAVVLLGLLDAEMGSHDRWVRGLWFALGSASATLGWFDPHTQR